MHPGVAVETALAMAERGMSASAIAASLDVPRSTVRDWLAGRVPRTTQAPCSVPHDLDGLPPAYVCLLGLYLGDGCISAGERRVARLRLSLDAHYPGIIAEARWAIGHVRGEPAGTLVRPSNCVEVYSHWRHWLCLFPQHGSGKKHERSIVLDPWQERLVDLWPRGLLRGLVQSDGCRFLNHGRGWAAPRYAFKQRSSDIRAIFCAACRRLGISSTHARDTVYVSRQADVARLDKFIGPKH